MPAAAAIEHQSDNVRNVDHGQRSPPIVVFRERAEARATLVANGWMDLQDAVDGLQEAAAAQGLLKEFGQDEIQQIMAESFARWRYDG
jgi:hypothetical protein